MKPNLKTRVILTACAGTILCFLLFALHFAPDPESLTYLQKMIADKGWCSISLPGNDCVIHADIALIENDSLILKRKGTTGDDSLVVVGINSGFTASAKSVSVRFIKEPADILELTLYRPGYRRMCESIKIERNWSLRKWFDHLCRKIKNIGK